MSTTVDNGGRRVRLSATESRARILAAARLAFTRAGYDTVGVREIAAAAGVDPAMVPRLFGSKEALFTIIANEAFELEPAFDGPLDGLGERVAGYLVQPLAVTAPNEFDEFVFLLRSVGSPAAAPILSAALHAGFIEPLAGRFTGQQAQARAALVTSYILGFAVLRVGLGSAAVENADRKMLARLLGEAIQVCLVGPES